MKGIGQLILTISLIFACTPALAAKARSISSDVDSAFHSEHLEMHVNHTTCCATGNYVKMRSSTNGNKVVGHLEQADQFILLDVKSGWVQIQITYSDQTSPDSWEGLTGWVNSDYINCECSTEEYYGNHLSRPEIAQPYVQILNWFYDCIVEKKGAETAIVHHFEPNVFVGSLKDDGYILRDLDGNGIDELIILPKSILLHAQVGMSMGRSLPCIPFRMASQFSC